METVEEVQALRGAIKWRPLKGQRLQRILTGQAEPEPEISSYLANWNANSVFIINIESQPALDRLDDLLAVPQLDAVLVGPHDLSINLGIPEQYEHPRFKEAIATIIRKAREYHVGVGIHYWLDIEQEAAWVKAGANFVVHSTDVTFFGQGLAREFKRLRSALGEPETGGSGDSVVI